MSSCLCCVMASARPPAALTQPLAQTALLLPTLLAYVCLSCTPHMVGMTAYQSIHPYDYLCHRLCPCCHFCGFCSTMTPGALRPLLVKCGAASFVGSCVLLHIALLYSWLCMHHISFLVHTLSLPVAAPFFSFSCSPL